jgi:hypothetical protein
VAAILPGPNERQAAIAEIAHLDHNYACYHNKRTARSARLKLSNPTALES